MTKTKPKDERANDIPQMPFKDALRKILSAPPEPRTAKEKG